MKDPATHYRVDLKSELSGGWMPYTSLRVPVDLEFAESLFEHLRRNKTGVRIVDTNTGKSVRESHPCDSSSEKK